MAGLFLSDCEAITIRPLKTPKGPVQKLFASSWPGLKRNKVHNLLPLPPRICPSRQPI
jgi:hypothetical protein